MYRKTDKNRAYNAGKTKGSQELLQMHMSNHYRRILNAKKVIDNSPPYCFKLKKIESRKSETSEKKRNHTFENLPLTDRSISTNSNKDSYWGAESGQTSSRYHAKCVPRFNSAYGNVHSYNIKHGPDGYQKEDCTTAAMKEEQGNEKPKEKPKIDVQPKESDIKTPPNSERIPSTADSHESTQKRKFTEQKKLKSSGVPVKGQSLSSLDGKMTSKILKTEAVSKLRSLRVYHPPRRKESRSKTDTEMSSVLEAPNNKFTKIYESDERESAPKKNSLKPKEQSLTSSRDSAYNGGVSSLPESRSPTPDHRKKKECCCFHGDRKKEKKFFESCKTNARVAEFSEGSECQIEEESFKKLQEDALYMKFIQDITTEILEKKLYTDKALKKIMKKHLKNNLKELQKDRMLKEIAHLRMQLGIPDDKCQLEDESGSYPLISDSEFWISKKETKEGSPGSDKFGKSVSEIISLSTQDEKMISDSETEDVISVIQVMKAVRDRQIGKSVERKIQVSSDESDRPSDPKKRSVLKNRKQKLSRSFSSTSSESDVSGKFLRQFGVNSSISKEVYLGKNKKDKNVSFWKNSGISMKQTLEVKHKKFARGKESIE